MIVRLRLVTFSFLFAGVLFVRYGGICWFLVVCFMV